MQLQTPNKKGLISIQTQEHPILLNTGVGSKYTSNTCTAGQESRTKPGRLPSPTGQPTAFIVPGLVDVYKNSKWHPSPSLRRMWNQPNSGSEKKVSAMRFGLYPESWVGHRPPYSHLLGSPTRVVFSGAQTHPPPLSPRGGTL
jgi:hypothetical protein